MQTPWVRPVLLALVGLLCVGGCQAPLYVPTPPVGLHLQEAGDVDVSGTAGAHGVQVDAAVRLPGRIGVAGSVHRGVQLVSNRLLAYPDSVRTQHHMVTVQVGAYVPMPAPYTASVFVGRGRGTSEGYSPRTRGVLFTDRAFASADVERWFVEPSIGRRVENGIVSATLGVSRLRFREVYMVRDPFGPSMERVREPGPLERWSIEPGLSARFGRSAWRISSSMGLSVPITDADAALQPGYRPLHVSVGVTLRLSTLFR